MTTTDSRVWVCESHTHTHILPYTQTTSSNTQIISPDEDIVAHLHMTLKDRAITSPDHN